MESHLRRMQGNAMQCKPHEDRKTHPRPPNRRRNRWPPQTRSGAAQPHPRHTTFQFHPAASATRGHAPHSRTPNPREPGLAGRRRGASAFLRATLIHKRHAPRTSVVSTWAHTRLFHALPTPVPPTAHLVIRRFVNLWAARARQDPTR